MALAFRQVYNSHIQHVIENSSFCTIYKSSVSAGFAEQIMRILRYNGSLNHLNGRKRDNCQV
jgi:hypothetical protein